MHTLPATIVLPTVCKRKNVSDLCYSFWTGGDKEKKVALRKVVSMLEQFSWLKLDRAIELLDNLEVLSKMTAKTRNSVLEVVFEMSGWLIDLCESNPEIMEGGVEVNHNSVQPGSQVVLVRGKCRECYAPSSVTCYPSAHPEFCSEQCALSWLSSRSEDISKFQDLDGHVKKQVDQALAELRTEMEGDQKQAIEYEVEEALDSNENPLLDLIRTYGSSPLISCEEAARKLENLLRSGQISL